MLQKKKKKAHPQGHFFLISLFSFIRRSVTRSPIRRRPYRQTSCELCKCEVKVHYQVLILVSWWEAGRIVGCLEICLWRKINLSSPGRLRSKKKKKNPAAFPLSSPIWLPLSHSFISASQSPPHSVSLSIQRKIKQLTMMIKVTGPIKLHMKWLSTLSQHLQQRSHT